MSLLFQESVQLVSLRCLVCALLLCSGVVLVQLMCDCLSCADYVRLLKYGDSLYRCKELKRAALVRNMPK